MQPFSASVSRLAQRFAVENGSTVRTPPGAAWYSSIAASEALPPRTSHSSSQVCRVGACTACTSPSSRPPRFSSPRIAGMPPARCTSSMWNWLLGATLATHGTRRETWSMSLSPKPTPASCAAASRCRTVLVEPPIATSRAIALPNAAGVAIARGSTDSSSPS